MKFNEAIAIIRKRFPKNFIIEAYYFRKKWFFMVLSKDYTKMHFDQCTLYTVDKSGNVEPYDGSYDTMAGILSMIAAKKIYANKYSQYLDHPEGTAKNPVSEK